MAMATADHTDLHWGYAVIFDDLHFCGCGQPEDNLELILKTLELAPFYEEEHWKQLPELLGPAHELVLYVLSDADLLEHGGNVGGSWLTDKGKRFLAICRSGDTETLMAAGYECSECSPRLKGKKGGPSARIMHI